MRWVAPFGNPRIKVCSRLPGAYRNVLRPSSPLRAKASTKCPFHTYNFSETVMRRDQPDAQRAFREDTFFPSGTDLTTMPRGTAIRTVPDFRVFANLFTMSKNCAGTALAVRRNRSDQDLASRIFPSPPGLPARRSAPFAGDDSLVEVNGIEPMTSCLQSRRSPN
jgi:hypothetical protein